MRRHILDAEITRHETLCPELRERFGSHSKEYRYAIERLKNFRHERMRRDTNFRKWTRRKAA